MKKIFTLEITLIVDAPVSEKQADETFRRLMDGGEHLVQTSFAGMLEHLNPKWDIEVY